jgi:hypothetical protein
MILVVQKTSQEQFQIDLEIIPAEGFFDRYLPNAGRTEAQVVAAVDYYFFGLFWQYSGGGPQQHMSIEQQPHFKPQT